MIVKFNEMNILKIGTWKNDLLRVFKVNKKKNSSASETGN